jgi:hypothetical protein
MERAYESEDFPEACLLKLVIKRGKLPAILAGLFRHGVTDSVVFPDLDGLAREIKRENGFAI